MSKGFELDAQLRIAIGDYWDIAQAEAHDQRDTDDEAGSAQAKWSEIDGLIRQLAEQRADLLRELQCHANAWRGMADQAIKNDAFDRGQADACKRHAAQIESIIANATQQRNATGGEG